MTDTCHYTWDGTCDAWVARGWPYHGCRRRPHHPNQCVCLCGAIIPADLNRR
jgi:hypothetical protein